MIRINLLPYREIRRKERRQRFYVLTAIVALVACVIALVIYSILDGRISDQQSRNDMLVAENKKLDKDIDEIKALQAKIESLLSRKQVIESLQRDRGNSVRLLVTLVTQIPDGIYLKGIKQVDKKITLTGYAQVNAKISMMIQNLNNSGFLEKTDIVETRAVVVDKRRLFEFTVTTNIRTEKTDGDQEAGKEKK